MNAMRTTALLVCSLAIWISVLDTKGAAPRVPDAETTTATPGGAHGRGGIPLHDENQSGRIFAVPPDARVVRHDAGGSFRQGGAASGGSERLIYSNVGDPFETRFYSPPLAGARIGDDIYTNAAGDCPIDSYSIRVIGGIPNAVLETFETRVALTTYCPSADYWGPTIPGTELSFPNLVADISFIHELVVDFTDPNIGICANDAGCRINAQDCYDGSECVTRTEPVIIPSRVWLRVEFTRPEAGWIVGAPPVVGFSTDKYDNYFTGCNTWFGGYPDHPHASFYAQFYASASCPTQFLAYLASDAQRPAYDAAPTGTMNQLLADDIELIIDRCELSTIEIGTKGIHGPYVIDFDLRDSLWGNPFPGTEHHWVSSDNAGNGNLEIARLEFPIGPYLDRNFWITWKANKPDTGLVNVGRTQIGGQCRTPAGEACNRFFAWYGPPWAEPGDWDIQRTMPDGGDAVFYVAVYCHGEPPVGPCCTGQPDLPGQDPVCIDNVPASSCLEGRWLDNASDPDRIRCPSTFYDGLCEDGTPCDVLAQDCPDSSCTAGVDCVCEEADDPWEAIGLPPCGTHACCKPNRTCADLPRDECVAITDDETGNPAVWNRGDFCGFNNQRCPFFACYYSSISCSDCNPQVWCDYEGDPICEALPWDSECDVINRACTIPRGCSNVPCCDWVCNIPGNSICCNVGWDCTCKALAQDCPGPPGNDNCWDDRRGFGPIEIKLDPAPGDPDVYVGYATSNHLEATKGDLEPGMCCHNQGVNKQATGTVWYKFRPAQNGSVRLHTCGTPGQPDGQDSIIQVFSAPFTDIGLCEDGSVCTMGHTCPEDACERPPCECYLDEQRLCETLVVEGCNDDAPVACGSPVRPGLSDLCIPDVSAGELYYVMVGTGSTDQQGDYRLDVVQPCDSRDIPPYASFCEGARTAYPGVNDYDLEDATLDCPGEECLVAMKNDVWFNHQPECTGYMLVRTCDMDVQTSEEDTTLAVYQGLNCPPGGADLLGCNDNAVSSEENHDLHGMPQRCAGTDAADCDEDSDCPKTCTIGGNACTVLKDCDIGVCEDGSSCSVTGQDCVDLFACVRAETCDRGVCISACWPGAMVEVPVSDMEWYKIRVGGYFGSEPSGNLTITCRQEDCNENHVPDIIDILDCRPEELWCRDCNQNNVPDACDLAFDPDNWKDCDSNLIPDRCQIRFDCSGPEGPYFCDPAERPCDPDVNNNCIVDSCEPVCPAGVMDWAGANPPTGVIDARQPHPLSGTTAQGIYTIVVDGPPGMSRGHECFDLCETRVDGAANFVASVTEGPAGTYTIVLDRPISAGAVTKISYHPDGGFPPDTGVFMSLPADANASGRSLVNDVTHMASCCLEGTCAPAYGGYSCDTNHSGLTTSEDILRLIDLLRGADGFAPWHEQSPIDDGRCD